MKNKFIILLLLQSCFLYAKELILDYDVNVVILDTGDINVTENITVNVENRQIKHGIYRDAPTVFYGMFFAHNNSDIILLDVKLDDNRVDYKTEKLINGIRIYIGSKNYYVKRGKHTYQIKYLAKNQIYNKDGDEELYWNITGNFWNFPIQHASAKIHLPNNSTDTIKQYNAWTGAQGFMEKDYKTKILPAYILFETTKPLPPKAGMTVKLSWRAGQIKNPENPTWRFIRQNIFWFLSIITLLWFPIYAFRAWLAVGIDPPKGAIFPRFEPPNNLSPATIRYIWQNYYSSECFSVAIMSMASKGFLTIEQLSRKKYLISKKTETNTKQKLSFAEKNLLQKLFTLGKKQVVLSSSYNVDIKNAYNDLKSSLKLENQDKYYKNNTRFIIITVAISVLALFFSWAHFFNFSSYAVNNLVISIATVVGSVVALHVIKKSILKIVSIGLLLTLLFLFIVTEQNKYYSAYMVIIFSIILINTIFYFLIQAPTILGRKTLDAIAGFKLYLQTAEKNRLELMNPPEITPQLFEKFLPFALALGVENSWSEQFNQAMKNQGKPIDSYQPNWYIGRNYNNFSTASIASAINSGLASSVASASTPPSSSSGGGGFSGGGGGGGGGGGW